MCAITHFYVCHYFVVCHDSFTIVSNGDEIMSADGRQIIQNRMKRSSCNTTLGEDYTHSKESCTHSKEPYVHSKEPDMLTKSPFLHSENRSQKAVCHHYFIIR